MLCSSVQSQAPLPSSSLSFSNSDEKGASHRVPLEGSGLWGAEERFLVNVFLCTPPGRSPPPLIPLWQQRERGWKLPVWNQGGKEAECRAELGGW